MAKGSVQTKNGFPVLTDRIYFGGKKPYKKEKGILEGDNPKGKIITPLPGVTPVNKRDQYSFAKKINDNSNYGIRATKGANFTKEVENQIHVQVEQALIQTIRAKKDYKDLFKPLNRTKLRILIGVLTKNFPITNQDGYKPGSNVLAVLKLFSYLKEDRTENKKFLASEKEFDTILAGAILYDYYKLTGKEFHLFNQQLEVHCCSMYPKDTKFIEFVEEVTYLISRIEYQELDSAVMEEFEHYDTKFKWLRAIKEPKLETIIDKIILSISNKGFSKVENDFKHGTMLLNLVKKLGLRYITTRSNLEWALYGPQLKRIRNFMSKKTYFVYLTTLEERIENFLLIENLDGAGMGSGESVNSNVQILSRVVKKMIEQKKKMHVHETNAHAEQQENKK